MSKNRVLRRIFVRVINSRKMGWAGHVACMVERIGVYGVLVEKHEVKKLRRPKRRGEDNDKMDLQEVGCGSMGWIVLADDKDRGPALVNSRNIRVP